jgi:hypothetical protein
VLGSCCLQYSLFFAVAISDGTANLSLGIRSSTGDKTMASTKIEAKQSKKKISKGYTKDQADKISEKLKLMPPVESEKLSKHSMIKLLSDDIKLLKEKGYSIEQIAEALTTTLRNYIQSLKPEEEKRKRKNTKSKTTKSTRKETKKEHKSESKPTKNANANSKNSDELDKPKNECDESGTFKIKDDSDDM